MMPKAFTRSCSAWMRPLAPHFTTASLPMKSTAVSSASLARTLGKNDSRQDGLRNTLTIYLQAQRVQTEPMPSLAQRWLNDLGALAGLARRARRPLEQGLLQQLLQQERDE